MSEGRTIRGAWVVIALVALGVIAGVAEVMVTRAHNAREPATVPATTTQSGGERTR
jgi:hypothetical protein